MSEAEKAEQIEEFVKMIGKHAIMFFNMMDLETHIECMLIDDNTKDEFVFILKKVEKHKGRIIEDGFGNSCSAICPQCKKESMQIVRPGKFQCKYCN